MDLTSVRRVKYALGVESAAQDHILARLVGAASKQVAHFLRRLGQDGQEALLSRERVEYLDPIEGKRTFYPRAYPITSIDSLYGDVTGLYTGSQVLVSDYHLSADSRAVILTLAPGTPDWYSQLPVTPRGARLTYTAGLAADPVLSTWTATGASSLTVGNFIQGDTSLAIGRVTAVSSGSLAYECLSGTFQAEAVKEYGRLKCGTDDAGPAEPTDVSATLTTCTSRSLAESEPALVEAVEMHVRFLHSNRNHFENLTVSDNGATKTSRADLKNRYDFLPEIVSMLLPYRNNMVGG